MRRTAWPAAVLSLALAHGALWAQARDGGMQANPLRSLQVSERDIRITPRYAGARVRVEGTARPDVDIVVKLTSVGRTVTFSRMGKVGPFWMSVGRIRVGNVPEMFKVRSSRPLQEILSGQEQESQGLGLRGLRASLTIDTGSQAELYLNELITAGKARGLYADSDTGVTRQGAHFATSFFWPAGATPGRYTVQAFAVQNQRVVGSRSVSIDVREVGIEHLVSAFARSHGILYGLGAVVLAALIGWLMSLLFDSVARLWPSPTPATGEERAAATRPDAPTEA